MPFATAIDGTRIAYDIQGSGEPLLLISGQGFDRHLWEKFSAAMAGRCTVIRYDYRGTGDSDKPAAPPYSTEMFADDAVAVLDAAGFERAHVFGYSMGGRVCQWLGIKHRARVASLILGATSPGNRHGIAREAAVSALFVNGDTAGMAEVFYSPAYLAQQPFSLPTSATPDFAKKLHFMASENHDTWERLPDIDCPTLVLHGSDDRVNPTANAQLLANAIPQAQLAIIDGARHGFIDEYLDETCRLIDAFIAAHALDDRGTGRQ